MDTGHTSKVYEEALQSFLSHQAGLMAWHMREAYDKGGMAAVHIIYARAMMQLMLERPGAAGGGT